MGCSFFNKCFAFFFFLSTLSHLQSSLSSFPRSENEETFSTVTSEWAWSRTGMMLITVIDNMQSRYYGWSNKLKVWLNNCTRWEAKVWPRTVQIHLRGMWMSMPICLINMFFILGHHIMTPLMSHPVVWGFMKGQQHLVSDRMLTPFPGESPVCDPNLRPLLGLYSFVNSAV